MIDPSRLRKILFHCVVFLGCIGMIGWAGEAKAQSRTSEEGLCSYYSSKAHGHMMSSGERYDKDGYTCAHRTLPFGTRVRVTNVANGNTAVVRVADRGPYGRTRVIDVSGAAARELGMLQAGVARVKVEVLPSEFEILEERHRYRMSNEPEYLKQFQLDPPDVRQELDWPDRIVTSGHEGTRQQSVQKKNGGRPEAQTKTKPVQVAPHNGKAQTGHKDTRTEEKK